VDKVRETRNVYRILLVNLSVNAYLEDGEGGREIILRWILRQRSK
jgi:hypothetical protein